MKFRGYLQVCYHTKPIVVEAENVTEAENKFLATSEEVLTENIDTISVTILVPGIYHGQPPTVAIARVPDSTPVTASRPKVR